MAQNKAVRNVNKVQSSISAEDYIVNGSNKRGKPVRPDGMSRKEWNRIMLSIRTDRALKALKACTFCVRLEDVTSEQLNRMLELIRSQYLQTKEVLSRGPVAPDSKVKTQKALLF